VHVYELLTQGDGYCNFALRDQRSNSIYHEFDGRSLAASWTPLSIEPADEADGDTDLADYALLGTVPIFSEQAVSVLSHVLTRNGELLPLLYDRRTYFAYNVTTIVDALDHERSALRRFKTGNIMQVERYAFRASAIGNAIVFRIPELLRAYVFVTDAFVRIAKSQPLSGFEFKLLWSDSRSG
jgi:hypothetical protein